MEGLEVLRERITALLKRYAAATNDQAGLKKELSILKLENEDLRAQLKHAEESLLALQIGKALPDEKMRAQSRKKLDAVIGEIDKILTTIND